MTAKEITERAIQERSKLKLSDFMPYLKDSSEGGIRDVMDWGNVGYYQWLTALMKTEKPKQVVELGGAMGVSALMMLAGLPKDSKLYSITLVEHGLEFSFIKENYQQLVKVLGDDLDLNNWPKDLDLGKTDIFFVDTLHTTDQLTKELELYKPFFKKGAILLLDDIHMAELEPVWNSLTYDKYDSGLHEFGFG